MSPKHAECLDHLCDEDCPCETTDFVIDHAALQEYAKELFGVELPLTVIRRQQKLDERTGMYSVARDCNGHMRYRFDADTGTIASIRITVVSGRSAKETLKTLAHEFQHVKQLLDLGPVELRKAYKRSRDAFEEAAIQAEKHWLDMGGILKERKQKENK